MNTYLVEVSRIREQIGYLRIQAKDNEEAWNIASNMIDCPEDMESVKWNDGIEVLVQINSSEQVHNSLENEEAK